MKYLVISVALISSSYGKEACDFKNIVGFKNKIFRNSPILEEVSISEKHAEAFVQRAGQVPNPEVNMQYSRGDQFGLEVNNYNISVLHTLELGDKRNSRLERSKAQTDLSLTELELSKYASLLDGIIDYRRAQQLDELTHALEEATQTYRRIIKKLSLREKLSPEEHVSMSTLKLALGDYEGRMHELVHEKESLIVRVEYLAGCTKPQLSYDNYKYKDISEFGIKDGSGLIALQDKKVNFAQKNMEVEKSLGYSNLKIGPIVNYQTIGEDQFVAAGVGITFDLPVFHTNDGGKAVAATNLRMEEVKARNHLNELNLKLKKEIHVYKHSLKALAKMPDLKSVHVKHKQVEKYFNRGVISIPMVIEAHRQYVDYMSALFEIENDVLHSIKNIYLITGNEKLVERLYGRSE